MRTGAIAAPSQPTTIARTLGLALLAELDQPTLINEHDGLHAVAHAELGENARHMPLDGGLGEEELLPNLDVGLGIGRTSPA
jgi:hypothetical protein